MQTAVDYIFEQLEEHSLFFRGTDNELNISISASDYLDLKRLAKEMERKSMIDFGNDLIAQNDSNYIGVPNLAEQYYNETYGSKGSDEIKTDKI